MIYTEIKLSRIVNQIEKVYVIMTEVKTTRPTSVTVISWFWIIVGIIMVFSALMGALAFMWTRQIPDHQLTTSPSNYQFEYFSFLLRHFLKLAILQIIIASVSITAGINFLRLRSWARTALELLSWLCLILVLSFAFFWILEWSMKMLGTPSQKFSILSLFMNVFFIVFYSIPLIVIIRFLRSKPVRTAVS